MRKVLLAVACIVAAGSVLVATGAAVDVAPSFRGVVPVVVHGSPNCKDLTGWVDPSRTYSTQIKFSAPINGTSGGGMNVVIYPGNTPGTAIGWYVLNNEDVRAVIVKGGPSANVYYYPITPATGDFSDGQLTTPRTLQKGKLKKGKLKFPNLDYMEFCYYPGPYVPPGA
jgi:hypothetical protein